MARQVLDHGVIIPAEYSDDWYEDMSTNLEKLDEVIGSDAGKLSEADVSNVALSGDYDDLTNKPDLKPVATSGDYDDLTDKPSYGILRMTSETLSDSGSGAISNLNSDSKLAAGDYVLDAALKVFPIAAVSAPNYTVGTSLFQITNASALAAVATSGSYDDLNNLPAYGITRFVNAAITDNSNVAFANISSVDKIKAGDFLLDNAGKMYLIASVDTVNETAAVTTPLTVLALDANVMHLSGDETASGQKTLVNLLPLKGEFLGTEASNNGRTLLYFIANRDTQNQSGIFLTKFRQNKPQGDMSENDIAYLSFDCLENSVRTNNGLRINFLNFVDNIPQRFILWSGITERLLGAAGAPWSDVSTNKINSLNPGSLSLPDLSNGIDISGYIDVNTTSEYTALSNGYISICGTASSTNAIAIKDKNFDYAVTGRALTISSVATTYVLIPVLANHTYQIICNAVTSIVWAKFFPNLGNV